MDGHGAVGDWRLVVWVYAKLASTPKSDTVHSSTVICERESELYQSFLFSDHGTPLVLSEESWKGQVTCHRKDTALSDQQIDLLIKTFLAQTDR